MALDNKIITVTDRETKKQVEKFVANYPNIRTLKGFLKGEWDLSKFDKCFTGRNRLGDVDASIEMNGHTLLIEFKGGRNAMNKGQILKAIRQAKYSNIVTMFIFGERNNPSAYLLIEPDAESETGFSDSGYVEASEDTITDIIADWSRGTSVHSLVESKTAEWQEVTRIMGGLY